MAMKVTLIHHVLITVRNLEWARYFYGQMLGLPELQLPNVGRPGLWFGLGTNELHIAVTDEAPMPSRARGLHPQERGREGRHIAFTVESLEETRKTLTAERIPYVEGTAGLPQIFCEDPEGNLIEINSGWPVRYKTQSALRGLPATAAPWWSNLGRPSPGSIACPEHPGREGDAWPSPTADPH